MIEVAEIVKEFLASKNVVDGTTGWNCYIAKIPDKPDKNVTVIPNNGWEPWMNIALDFPQLQIHIRGAINGYKDAANKAWDLRDQLLSMDPYAHTSGTILTAQIIGDMTFAGYDANERPVFTSRWQLYYTAANSANRQVVN